MMKLNYDFQQHSPPKLSLEQLRNHLAKRRLEKMIFRIVLAIISVYIGLILFAIEAMSYDPNVAYGILSIISFYLVATCVCSLMLFIYKYQRRYIV